MIRTYYTYALLGLVLNIAIMSKAYMLPHHLRIDFNQSMVPSSRFKIYTPFLLNNIHWRLAKETYDTNFLRNFAYSHKPTIPKIIHQIWLGSPLPDRYKQLQASWRRLHPDWKYILWTDKDVEAFGLRNKELYNAASNYGEKADIARYEILYRFGGLYADTDFECIRPFDLLHHGLDFYAGIVFRRELRVNNALIGAAAGHPILKYCIENMKRKPKNEVSMNATVTYTGPIHFTNMIMHYLKRQGQSKRCMLFPNTFFYPIAHFQKDIKSYKQVKQWIKAESFAVHYWDVSWTKAKKSKGGNV